MANWQYRLDIKDEYDEAKAGTLKPHEMAHRIAAKIKALGPWGIMLADIVDQFESMDERDTFDDTDLVMDQLYDWGDQRVGPRWDDKMCWIATR